MKTKFLYILLIISICLNLGIFSIMIFDRINRKPFHRVRRLPPPFIEDIKLNNIQLMEIDKIRSEWFEISDSLMNKIIALKCRLNEKCNDSLSPLIMQNLSESLNMYEDSHKMLFMNYYAQYEDILDPKQLKKFRNKSNMLIKIIRKDDKGDSVIIIDMMNKSDSNDLRIMKKIEKKYIKED